MRYPFGWDGQKFTNGSEIDWLHDFEIEMALLDRTLHHNNLYLAKPLVEQVAASFLQMGLEDGQRPQWYINGCRTLVARYPKASNALFLYLKRDNRRKRHNKIITPECYQDCMAFCATFLCL